MLKTIDHASQAEHVYRLHWLFPTILWVAGSADEESRAQRGLVILCATPNHTANKGLKQYLKLPLYDFKVCTHNQ